MFRMYNDLSSFLRLHVSENEQLVCVILVLYFHFFCFTSYCNPETFLFSVHTIQRSQLTFSKTHLLATFNCKMVTICKKKFSLPQKTWKWRTLYDILHEGLMRGTARFQHLRYVTVRERERRDCLVAKAIYFDITKLLRPGNIASGVQNPFKSIKFAILLQLI